MWCVAGSTGAFGSARQQATTGRRVILTRAANWRRGARRAPRSLRTSQAAARYLRYATLLGTSLAMLRLLGLAWQLTRLHRAARCGVVRVRPSGRRVDVAACGLHVGAFIAACGSIRIIRWSVRAACDSTTSPSRGPSAAAPAAGTALSARSSALRQVQRHACHTCTGTRLAVATSAPGVGSRRPHLHRDGAHSCHICTRADHICAGTWLAARSLRLVKPHRGSVVWRLKCYTTCDASMQRTGMLCTGTLAR